MKKTTLKAIEKYSKVVCLQAYKFRLDGEGGSTIGIYLGIPTNSACAAANAGEEISRADEEARTQALEDEGMTRSDAQGVVEAEDRIAAMESGRIECADGIDADLGAEYSSRQDLDSYC